MPTTTSVFLKSSSGAVASRCRITGSGVGFHAREAEMSGDLREKDRSRYSGPIVKLTDAVWDEVEIWVIAVLAALMLIAVASAVLAVVLW